MNMATSPPQIFGQNFSTSLAIYLTQRALLTNQVGQVGSNLQVYHQQATSVPSMIHTFLHSF